MASYQGQLSDEDIDNVIAFIQSLSDRNPNAGENTGSSESTESQTEQNQTEQNQAEQPAGSES